MNYLVLRFFFLKKMVSMYINLIILLLKVFIKNFKRNYIFPDLFRGRSAQKSESDITVYSISVAKITERIFCSSISIIVVGGCLFA